MMGSISIGGLVEASRQRKGRKIAERICPLQESNLHLALRRGSFYPLN